jgi:hypothetical protein
MSFSIIVECRLSLGRSGLQNLVSGVIDGSVQYPVIMPEMVSIEAANR